jgi:hypothetical protein
MKKIWVRKFESFKSARKFDIDYYLSMSSSERLESMQYLREIALKLKDGKGRKGLRRVVRVIQ